MHIRDYKYTAEDVDCRYCTEFRHGRCRAIKCPWLNERIEAGVISYHDAVNESFSSRSPLLRRIRLVLTFYDKSFWKDDDHFRRFQQADAILGFYKSRNTSEYYSALFLLTADHSLFLRERAQKVRSEGSTSCSSVQQALNCTFYTAKALKTPELSQFRGFSF